MNIIDIKCDARYLIDRNKIRATIHKVLNKEKLENIDVSVIVVGKRKMQELNNKYRNMDYPTNVLSFCQYDLGLEENDDFVSGDGRVYLGDVVICYPVAVEQARESWMLVDDWIDELVEHSMQHLLGRHHN